MQYKKGFKYQLYENLTTEVGIYPKAFIYSRFITLTTDGLLTIFRGYAWDGPSGPTFDTKAFMRGSLIHDALYQLMREGHLPLLWRMQADKELRRACEEDGMYKVRAWYAYRAVRALARKSASGPVRPVLVAP